MKWKEIFKLKNISNFIEGNYKYYRDKIKEEPKYLREQRLYRLSLCKDDCVPNESCIYCTCDPKKKIFNNKSCNKGKRFPDIMDEDEWIRFKSERGIK